MLSQLARARTARRRKKKKRVARGYGTPTPQCNGAAGSISSDANLLMDEVVDDDSLLATFSIWGSSPNRVVQYIYRGVYGFRKTLPSLQAPALCESRGPGRRDWWVPPTTTRLLTKHAYCSTIIPNGLFHVRVPDGFCLINYWYLQSGHGALCLWVTRIMTACAMQA
jgi:hypothetical protein